MMAALISVSFRTGGFGEVTANPTIRTGTQTAIATA
jgi:hypothetical protein